MCKVKLLLFAVVLAAISTVLQAQNSIKSPYTRFGYGKLSDQTYGYQRGMGGIGIGLRNSQAINSLNPASLSSVDSMTFMFDAGVMGQMAWYEEGGAKSKKMNGNIEYIAIQFLLAKNLGLGLGFKPVTHVGYNYGNVDSLAHIEGVAQSIYSGNGGLSKIYAGLSYHLFSRLSLGINVGYLFGDIIHNSQKAPVTGGDGIFNVLKIDTLRTSSFVYEAGLQYTLPIDKNKTLVFGAIFSPKIKINTSVNLGEIRIDPSSGVVQTNPVYYSTRDSIFEFPEIYGLGFTFNERNKLTAGLDVQYQRWSSARFYDKTDSLTNQLKINLGGEYIPDYRSNRFLKRMRYRLGAYYSNSYINIAGKGYKEYGASLGFGIPLNDRRSLLNLAFDYSRVKPNVESFADNIYINEQYFKITVSYTFNELWFFKRKVQ
jgi:hypothetical protein